MLHPESKAVQLVIIHSCKHNRIMRGRKSDQSTSTTSESSLLPGAVAVDGPDAKQGDDDYTVTPPLDLPNNEQSIQNHQDDHHHEYPITAVASIVSGERVSNEELARLREAEEELERMRRNTAVAVVIPDKEQEVDDELRACSIKDDEANYQDEESPFPSSSARSAKSKQSANDKPRMSCLRGTRFKAFVVVISFLIIFGVVLGVVLPILLPFLEECIKSLS